MRTVHRLTLLTCLILAACQGVASATPTTSESANPPETTWDDRTLFGAGLIEAQQSILNQLPGASIYHIDLTIENDLIHVNGIEEVRYTNQEDTPLENLEFRLFPNILEGALTVSSISIDGNAVTPGYDLENSLMIISLTPALQPGQSVVVHIDFAVTVPTELTSNYGVLASTGGVLTLAHSYPMIPVYDNEGWNAEIPPTDGDLTYADASFYRVRITAPIDLVQVASGREVDKQAEDKVQVVTFAAGPARDFFLAASRNYEVLSRKAGEVLINSYAPAEMKAGAQLALDTAAKTIEDFNKRYGKYPYTEFDIVTTPTYALGIEYPGIAAITTRIYDLETELNNTPTRILLESTVAHETGHQWFYNLVGNDQIDDPWLDESLTQFVTWQYYQDTHGPEGAQGFKQSLESRWARVNRADIPIGLPVREYQDKEYGAIVYGRGGLFFDALKQQMGQDNFDAFIKDYVQKYAWGITSGDGLKQLAEEHCGCDLTPLFEKWVYP